MNAPPTCTYCAAPVAEGYVALCAGHLATCIPCMQQQHAACLAPCTCEQCYLPCYVCGYRNAEKIHDPAGGYRHPACAAVS